MRFAPYLSKDMEGFKDIPVPGRLLYVSAQVRPARSLADLAEVAGIGERTAYRVAKLLTKHGWFRMEHKGHHSLPVPIMPLAEDERRAQELRACYELAHYKGEFLLWALLDAVAFMDGAVHNARPDFLVHPVSGEKLEYDVFNPETMDAWELQGFQHFGPTDKFPSDEKARQQQANDFIKLGQSLVAGVNVIVLTYKDLSIDGILKTLPDRIARRPLDRTSKFLRALEKMATGYRRWAAATDRELKSKRQQAHEVEGIPTYDWLTVEEQEQLHSSPVPS